MRQTRPAEGDTGRVVIQGETNALPAVKCRLIEFDAVDEPRTAICNGKLIVRGELGEPTV